MTDYRYQGQGMRRRAGAAMSHLEAANAPDLMDPEAVARRVQRHNELSMPGHKPSWMSDKQRRRSAESFSKQANIPKVPYYAEDAADDRATGRRRGVWSGGIGGTARPTPDPDRMAAPEPGPALPSTSPACGYHSALGRPCTCKR